MPSNDKVSRFLALNHKANVEPEILELFEAYLRLKSGDQEGAFKFYQDDDILVKSRFPTVNRFLKQNAHVDPRVAQFLAQYAEEMRKKRLPFIFNRKHLASLIDVDVEALEGIIQQKPAHYRTFHINKVNLRGKRVIEAPNELLKTLQRRLSKRIFENMKVSGYAHAYRRNRSVKTNASFHENKYVVLRIDIKDFFHSFSTERVRSFVEAIGYTRTVANSIAELATYKGRMPMGAATSPVLSNLLSWKLDKRLASLATQMNANYTRYADDMVFSSNSRNLPTSIPLIYEILEDEGFVPNKKKTVVRRQWQRQVVTGVVVNKDANIAKEEYRKLRAVLHNCSRDGVYKQAVKWGARDIASFKNSLHGKISYVRYIKPSLGDDLLKKYNTISWNV